jgi:hypothetical protein
MKARKNKIVLGFGVVGVGLAAIHYLVRTFIPAFSVLYDGSERPQWIPITIDAEFLIHLLFLGALISVTARSIPGVNKPSYSNEGTESVFNYSDSDVPIDWSRILTAWACVPVYVLAWAVAYGYLKF